VCGEEGSVGRVRYDMGDDRRRFETPPLARHTLILSFTACIIHMKLTGQLAQQQAFQIVHPFR
jgi:hypothetical protein